MAFSQGFSGLLKGFGRHRSLFGAAVCTEERVLQIGRCCPKASCTPATIRSGISGTGLRASTAWSLLLRLCSDRLLNGRITEQPAAQCTAAPGEQAGLGASPSRRGRDAPRRGVGVITANLDGGEAHAQRCSCASTAYAILQSAQRANVGGARGARGAATVAW